MAISDFKVIVVGGGPVGLTAAHALNRAGIDFVLLERQPEIAMNAGSNLVLSPFGLQAMTQLGIAQALSDVSTPLGRQERLDHFGQDIGDMVLFEEMDKILGVAPRVISRYSLTSNLFKALSLDAQAKCLPSKKLCSIQTTQDGVTASCADGSSYFGHIIIGADGAHSATRNLMHSLDHGIDGEWHETPFLTTYRCLWIRFATPKGLPLGTTCETHGYGASTQLFAGEDSAVMALYERLEKPTSDRTRYTTADRDSIVDRWGDLPLIPNNPITLRDVYTGRMDAGLVSLEEGVVKDWSHGGRAVLVGDAAHKFTPSTGAGCNNGILDVAALVGELIEATRTTPATIPNEAALESAFKSYESTRRAVVEFECRSSSEKTALATWQDERHEYVDKNVMNGVELQQDIVKRIADALTKAPAFDLAVTEQRAADVKKDAFVLSTPLASIAIH